jgi:hypothetical protein
MKTILLTIILSVASFISQCQTKSDSPLLDSLVAVINAQIFKESYTFKSIPKFIRKQIKTIEGKKFKAADKGKDFNESDIGSRPFLAYKRIIYVATAPNLCIVTYQQRTFRIPCKTKVIFYTGKKIDKIIDLAVPMHDDIEDFKVHLQNHDVVISDPFS